MSYTLVVIIIIESSDTIVPSKIFYSFKTPKLNFELALSAQLNIICYQHQEQSWVDPSQAPSLFAIYIGRDRYDASNLHLVHVDTVYANGYHDVIAHFKSAHFTVTHTLRVYLNTALTEQWQEIRAISDTPITLNRIDSMALVIPKEDYTLHSFASQWGEEFQPHQKRLSELTTLETRTGRSSKTCHPYFALETENGWFASSIAWSGNWVTRFEPTSESAIEISSGLHDWNFSKTLHQGDVFHTPHIVLAIGATQNSVAQDFAYVGRKYWYPHNQISQTIPVEWNHWWSYEDIDINDTLFAQNINLASQMGMELTTLDAGWFGPDDATTHWGNYRGDWEKVNKSRFPQGIRPLAQEAHNRGVYFGLWCEIEGLGPEASLNKDHPDFPAQRDGKALGYVCLGNPDAQEWAYQTLARLIESYDCDWIKLDFNLDPEAGCNRTDHGHDAEDGLYEHYQGYYQVLDRIRTDYPHVLLENCASGGLRVDLEILKHTHATFLSDTDWPVHSLQVFWGASLMFAPNICLRWTFSQWRAGNGPKEQNFNPHDPHLQLHQLDYYTRIAMLGWLGFSQKLPQLPMWVAVRLKEHIQIYKTYIKRFVLEGVVYRLTDQPQRDGSGDRWCAFQYSIPPTDEHLLYIFRLPDAKAFRQIVLHDLNPHKIYQIAGFEGEVFTEQSGNQLMTTGFYVDFLPEEGSLLIQLSERTT